VQIGSLLSPEGSEIDQGLGWVLPGPGSYTGEDTVEITGHGSDLVMGTALDNALQGGAVLAEPGEFTRRAFLNGRLDLIQAEAVVDLIQAGSREGVGNAYGHLSGGLSARVDLLRTHLVRALSLLEVSLDFSQEDIGPSAGATALQEIQQVVALGTELIDTFEGVSRRQRGRLVALVGRPNVGKSTLLNSLLGEDRAIVTPVPGTTRDAVEGQASWRGEWVRLVDTAGLRSGGGVVESEGVRRARRMAAEADVVVLVLDGARAWEEEDGLSFGLLAGRPAVVAINKSDLPRRLELPADLAEAGVLVEISALRMDGLEDLKLRCLEGLPPVALVDGVGLSRPRHRDLLERATEGARRAGLLCAKGHQEECAAAELQQSLRLLGVLLGEGTDDAVLDEIFSEFCIGK